ncbi:MAG: hypothetical protein IPM63_10170 [Acidobacteriota bacterium]|nr:MAG: hypothetical protein IPM63_10170 [Acidobacteriota bacterium]
MSESRDKNIERIIRLMQTDDSADAPSEAVKWSKNIFRTRQKQPSALQKIKAVLKLDIAPGQAVFGERSGAAEARQMLFEAGEFGIDLRVSASEHGFEVRGQVLGEGFENREAILGQHATQTNDLGEFVFEAVEAGTYAFSVGNGEEEIVIEGIEIS